MIKSINKICAFFQITCDYYTNVSTKLQQIEMNKIFSKYLK